MLWLELPLLLVAVRMFGLRLNLAANVFGCENDGFLERLVMECMAGGRVAGGSRVRIGNKN